MEVKIVFDTEKESADDLRKLAAYIQELINKKQGNMHNVNGINVSSSQKVSQSTPQQPQVHSSGQTSGGGRVIPYEDMSGKLSQILMGRN